MKAGLSRVLRMAMSFDCLPKMHLALITELLFDPHRIMSISCHIWRLSDLNSEQKDEY